MPEQDRRRIAAPEAAWPWGPLVLGLAGSLAVAVAGPGLAGGAVSWWFSPSLDGAGRAVLYAGMVAMVLAWAGLAARSRDGSLSVRRLLVIAGCWTLPLALGAPLFSRDVYSYLAQGTIEHLGLSPYSHTPAALTHLGQVKVLNAVSPFWRHTTAPYGPLFLALMSAIAALAGTHLVAGALLARLVELPGLVLLAVCLPRIAPRLGASPSRATWAVLLNPLVLLELVAPAHNDLLMAGLMAAGVLLALERRPLWGIAVCALAATIKLPALAAVVFIAVAWVRALPEPRDRARAVAWVCVVTAGVLALVSIATGLGLEWISSSVFSTPGRVHLAITPSTAVGWTVASVLRDLGLHAGTRSLESAFGVVSLVIVIVIGLELLWRLREETLVRNLAIVLLALALGGPAAWPWYFTWGLVLIAACPPGRRRVALVVGCAAGVFVVKPDGILALSIGASPVVLAVYVILGALALGTRTRGRRVAPAAA